MERPWLRRALMALPVIALVAAAVWWLGRPKPIAVALTEVGRGRVEATIANTRAGTVQACQRTKLSANAIDNARAAADAKSAGCATARADVAQAEANVRPARVQQGRTALVARFDGTVAKIVGEVGEYSTPSPPGVPTPPAIDLIDESCLYVKAPMDEVDAPRTRDGPWVRISLDALPKQSFPGKVKRIAPHVTAVEKQARTVDVEATFDDASKLGRLRVGYSADVEIVLESREDVLRVPTSALLEGGRAPVIGPDGKPAERRLKTGLANWEFTEVIEGLAAGEKIVTSLERAEVKAGAAAVAQDKPADK